MSKYDKFNPTDRAELEQMSTDELNDILDASLDPEARISADTILLVLEVLEDRAEDTQTPELDAAWEVIKNENLPQAGETSECENNHEMDKKNEHTVEPLPKKRRSFAKVAGIAAAVLIVIYAAGSLIPTAQGSNFWTSFIEWTKETFGFDRIGEELVDVGIPAQLNELNNYLIDYELVEPNLLPMYIPEGYQTVSTIVDERENVVVFFSQLQNDNGDSIMLQYRFWKDLLTADVQKDDDLEEPEKYQNPNGQEFFIAQNEGLYNATWLKGNVECTIYNVPSREELIMILDSIRGE